MKFPAVLLVLTLALTLSSSRAGMLAVPPGVVRQDTRLDPNFASLALPNDFGCGLGNGEVAAKVAPVPFFAFWPGISSINNVYIAFRACRGPVAVLSEADKRYLLDRICRPLERLGGSPAFCSSIKAPTRVGPFWRFHVSIYFLSTEESSVRGILRLLRFVRTLSPAVTNPPSTTTITQATSAATTTAAVSTSASQTTQAPATGCVGPHTGRTLYVGPNEADCVGARPRKCLLVGESADGPKRLFRNSIEGFDRVEGTTYVLFVGIHQVSNSPPEISSLCYRLIAILEQTTTLPPTEPPTEPPTTTTTRLPTTTTRTPTITTTTTRPLTTTTTTARPTTTTTARPTTTTTTQSTQATTVTTNDKCDGFRVVRKDVKKLTDDEWNNYVEAHRRVRVNGKWANFSRIHNDHGRHRSALFLIWHRLMLYEWDRALDEAFPGVVQPYYNWSTVSTNVFADPIWNADGRFQTWQVPDTTQTVISDGFENLPVTRSFSDAVLQDSDDIADIVTATTGFFTFTRALEGVHNTFHVAVGGDMTTFDRAPNDIAFYMHHAFVDKIWKDWQDLDNTVPRTSSVDLDMNFVLQPWGKTVSEVLDASECTNYERSGGGSTLDVTGRAIQVGSYEVYGAEKESSSREYIFETKDELIDYKKAALEKIIAMPIAVKKEVAHQLRIENDMIQACRAFGADPVTINSTVKILRDVLLIGNHNVDLGGAEELVKSSPLEAISKAQLELQEITDTGNLPGEEAADLIYVKNFSLTSLTLNVEIVGDGDLEVQECE